MNNKKYYYLFPPIMVVAISLALTLNQFGYYPVNALRSTQMYYAASVVNNEEGRVTDTGIDLLRSAVILSSENCRARDGLGMFLFSAAFHFGNEQKGVYDKAFAEEMLANWNVVKKECKPFLLNAYFFTGYAYYLMNEPLLAIQELTIYLSLNPHPTGGILNNSVNAYDIISKSYADLQDNKNAATALMISLSLQGGSDSITGYITEYTDKVNQINQYLKESDISIIPRSLLGFGRYPTAVKQDNQIMLFGVSIEYPSALVSIHLEDYRLISSQVINVTENERGSIGLDKNGNTHIAYSFGPEYIIYANSMDDFIDKTIIDTRSIASSGIVYTIPAINSVQIAVDNQNQPHLIWSQVTSQGESIIEYTVIKAGKAETPEVVASNAIAPDIKALGDNRFGVVYNNWASFPDSSTQVWYAERDDSSWKEPVQISNSEMWAGAASILLDVEGVIHVFYITGTSPEDVALMHVVRDLQGNWQKPEIIGSESYRPFLPKMLQGNPISFSGRTAPSVTLLPGNRIAVVWRGPFVNGYTEILGREYVNGVWQTTLVLGKIAGQDYTDTPSIILKNEDANTISLIWLSDGQIIPYEWKP